MKRGFTLMEVLLAASIAAIVFAAIGVAIDFQLRVLNSGRQEVEQAQLGRALLRRIADDVRSTVPYQPIDVEALLPSAGSAVAASAAASAASALTGGTSGTSGSSGSSNSSNSAAAAAAALSGTGGTSGTSGSTGAGSSSTSGTNSTATEVAASTAPPTIPGLYGNQYELQVDVSRLPRVDQYEQFLDPNNPVLPDLVSDVKTVAYYVPATNANGGVAGLVRREMDRAAARFAANQGVDQAQREEVIAPEVTAIEFRYYDGAEWLTEWDSEVTGTLPVAIEIAIALAPLEGSAGAAAAAIKPLDRTTLSLSDPSTMPGYPIYRLLVNIPAAKAVSQSANAPSSEDTETGTGTNTSSTNSSNTSSSNTGSSGSGASGT